MEIVAHLVSYHNIPSIKLIGGSCIGHSGLMCSVLKQFTLYFRFSDMLLQTVEQKATGTALIAFHPMEQSNRY